MGSKISKKFKMAGSSKGSIGVWVIITLVLVGSIYFVRGIFPDLEHIDIGEEDIIAVPIEEEDRGTNRNNLHLRTIEFEKCTESVAVGLLVDTSGSMSYGNPSKISELREALISFSKKLSDDSVIGLYQFSIDFEAVEEFKLFSEATSFVSKVNSLQPQEATHTRSALEDMRQELSAAQQEYPDHNFALIVFSDGIPEAVDQFETERYGKCCQSRNPITGENFQRCISIDQNPTTPSNIGEQIQNMGVRVFSITLLDKQDTCFNSELKNIMQSIASPESYKQTFNQEDLTRLYNEITFTLCGQPI